MAPENSIYFFNSHATNIIVEPPNPCQEDNHCDCADDVNDSAFHTTSFAITKGQLPNARHYRAAERPHLYPREPHIGGSGACPCYACARTRSTSRSTSTSPC